ncbi:uncharacterized tatC-like protein ymf16 [Solanum stenotomum]|uniref:uncharacterized tatC-like protein ymf16 n=1 Tax=Solanum stenotomum TaxID=172797 RepID=UPI0020D11988|nr:uncharacterized tatC-like protein ymf16 [Solanum stenotomum]
MGIFPTVSLRAKGDKVSKEMFSNQGSSSTSRMNKDRVSNTKPQGGNSGGSFIVRLTYAKCDKKHDGKPSLFELSFEEVKSSLRKSIRELIACSYFVFPLISHQMWCFLIPSCYGEQRTKYNRFLHLSGSRFSLFLFLTPPRVVPNVWHFPYFMGATSTNLLMIKLQPKIYDHIMLTVRISFIPSVCSQVPAIVIRLPEPRGLSVETSTNYRRFLMVFLLLTAALSTPPDIWCQMVAPFLISLIIELAIFVASILQVCEEGWTSGMRESGSIDQKKE